VNFSKYSSRAVCLLAVLPLVLTAQRVQEHAVPLKNWASPLYWHPNPGEREAGEGLLPRGSGPPPPPVPTFLTFVAMTPCRLVDTRGAAVGFNGIEPFVGPSIPSAGTVVFPVQSASEATTNTMPAPCGAIPSIAKAYSFNVTVIAQAGAVDNYVTLWPTGLLQPVVSTVNDTQSSIVANAAIVAVGTGGSVNLYNSGPATIDVVIDMNGYFAAPTDLNDNTAIGVGTLASNTNGVNNTASGADALQNNTVGGANTASGAGALQSNASGDVNTASGYYALQSNTSGFDNAASGAYALRYNTTGFNNTAVGTQALQGNTTGIQNTASGFAAMLNNTIGYSNTASGYYALRGNTTGNYNTASGYYALDANTIGSGNIAIGQNALLNSTTGNGNIAVGNGAAINAPAVNSNSIYIGSQGTPIDVGGTVQIGIPGTQTSFFAAGVTGVTTGLGDAVNVVIDSNGQLGTMVSSERFKEDIQDMGDASSGLLRLRPVTYRYKQAYKDGSKPTDYGLIAEEVADIYPDLVVKNKDGQIQTVQYQKLTPMLLNELQKQTQQIHSLEDRLAALEALEAAAPEPVR
jgi:hypothetical protein